MCFFFLAERVERSQLWRQRKRPISKSVAKRAFIKSRASRKRKDGRRHLESSVVTMTTREGGSSRLHISVWGGTERATMTTAYITPSAKHVAQKKKETDSLMRADDRCDKPHWQEVERRTNTDRHTPRGRRSSRGVGSPDRSRKDARYGEGR